MYGRIGDVIREQSGLAYYAYTRLNSGIGPGSWEVSAGVNPVNVEKTIALVKKEIKRFVTEPVLIEEAKRQPGELYRQTAVINGIECRRGISPGQPGTVPVGVGLLSGLCQSSQRSHS